VNTPGSPIPWPFLRLIPPVHPKVQCPWPPTLEAGPLSVCVTCTRRDPSATTPAFWGRPLTHCHYGQTVHPWLKRPTRYHMIHLELWSCDRRCIARFPSVSAIRSADPANPTVEPNMKWIGRPLAEIWPFEISPILAKWESRSVVGRSVLNIYFFWHWSHILFFSTLGT